MKEALNWLRHEIGPKAVLTNNNDMQRYLDDLIGATVFAPVAVLRPETVQQVAIATKWCVTHDLKIIPQGGLTGLSSGAVPLSTQRCAIISLGRMNKIRNLDTSDNTMTVDAGVILADIRAAAENQDRYFPLSHGGEGSSQIGGNLSTNSGGNNAICYGTARDQVLGLEVVLPDGTIWNGLKRLRKNTAGYDLKQLFIGAEGSLGLITGAVLKLRPFPHNRATAFVSVANPATALRLLRLLETHVGEMISAFELLSEASLTFALQIEGTRHPLETRDRWYVLIEVETSAKSINLSEQLEAGLEVGIETGLISDATIAQSISQRNALWHLRESVATAFIEDKSTIKSDTAVPLGEVAAYLENTTARIAAYLPQATCAPFGHLGDGNIHFNVAKSPEMSGPDFLNHWGKIKGIIDEEALKLGGTISAEHGIGSAKKPGLARSTDDVQKKLMSQVRNAIDIEARMNEFILFDQVAAVDGT